MGWFGEDTALKNELEHVKNENTALKEENRRLEERLREQETTFHQRLDHDKCENASRISSMYKEIWHPPSLPPKRILPNRIHCWKISLTSGAKLQEFPIHWRG